MKDNIKINIVWDDSELQRSINRIQRKAKYLWVTPLLIILAPWICAVLFILACAFKTEIDEITNTLWFQNFLSTFLFIALAYFVALGTLRVVNKMILKK